MSSELRPLSSSNVGKCFTHSRSNPSYHSRRKVKAVKALDSKCRYVLDRDVLMNKVESLCCRALIGCLECCLMNKEEWLVWTKLHWKPLLDYVPTISLLANKWLIFVFLEDKDATLILNTLWTIKKGSLVLSHWHSNFDPPWERVIKRHQ